MAVSELELAWFAGLMEGEGCFRVRGENAPRRPRLAVSLNMTDKDVVERASALFPGVSVTAQKAQKTEWTPSWRVDWTGNRAESIMRAVLPHMGQRRKAKIIECLNTPNLSHHPKGT